MIRRLPTPEERRLWRESNRFTKKKIAPDEPEVAAEEVAEFAVAVDAPRAAKPVAKKDKIVAPTPLMPLTSKAATRQLKSRGPIKATLDLHGFTKLDAYECLQQFITKHHALGHRHLLIITGKGKVGEGVLRRAVPQWLNEPVLRRMVAGIAIAAPEKGGEGALHVLLKAL